MSDLMYLGTNYPERGADKTVQGARCWETKKDGETDRTCIRPRGHKTPEHVALYVDDNKVHHYYGWE